MKNVSEKAFAIAKHICLTRSEANRANGDIDCCRAWKLAYEIICQLEMDNVEVLYQYDYMNLEGEEEK